MNWRNTMLECREYSYQELCSIFNTHDARSIKNRLTRWNVEYTYKGRGANLKLTIQNIHDPFRVFCILELSYSPQTDFVGCWNQTQMECPPRKTAFNKIMFCQSLNCFPQSRSSFLLR